jgi:hypothetical protein
MDIASAANLGRLYWWTGLAVGFGLGWATGIPIGAVVVWLGGGAW